MGTSLYLWKEASLRPCGQVLADKMEFAIHEIHAIQERARKTRRMFPADLANDHPSLAQGVDGAEDGGW